MFSIKNRVTDYNNGGDENQVIENRMVVVGGGGDIVLCGSYFQITMNKLSDIMNDIMFVLFLSFKKRLHPHKIQKQGRDAYFFKCFRRCPLVDGCCCFCIIYWHYFDHFQTWLYENQNKGKEGRKK